MALSFLTSSEQTQEVVVTCDPEVTASAEQRSAYLESGDLSALGEVGTEAPIEERERAEWHHALSDDERKAMSDYQAYLNRVYQEMINSSLILIDGEEADAEQLQLIRPESHRIQTVSELVLHIQRISLLGIEGK
jgi:hypothetical protein